MLTFLSPAWVEAVDQALRAAQLASDERLSIAHRVDDGRGYRIEVDEHGARALVAVEADVTFFENYATACAIARGELTAQEAVASGRLRVRGDVGRLGRHTALLTAVADALSTLRPQTAYD